MLLVVILLSWVLTCEACISLAVHGLSVLSQVCTEGPDQGSNTSRRNVDNWDSQPCHKTAFRCSFVRFFPIFIHFTSQYTKSYFLTEISPPESRWAKWAAEHNGYLGTILRKALDSYLKSDMWALFLYLRLSETFSAVLIQRLSHRFSSLLYYMVAAECGYAPAQFNVAYLCEQNTVSYLNCNSLFLLIKDFFDIHVFTVCVYAQLGFLDPAFASDCMWRYYNLTTQSQNPDTHGNHPLWLYYF